MKAVNVRCGMPAILAGSARAETGDEVGAGDEAVEVGVGKMEVEVGEDVGEGAEIVVANVVVANERAVVMIGLINASETESGPEARLEIAGNWVFVEEPSTEVDVKTGARNTGSRDSVVLEFVLGNVRFKSGVWVMLKNPDEKVELPDCESVAFESCTSRKKILLDDNNREPESTTQE